MKKEMLCLVLPHRWKESGFTKTCTRCGCHQSSEPYHGLRFGNIQNEKSLSDYFDSDWYPIIRNVISTIVVMVFLILIIYIIKN